ncbi:hypothetical protein ZWY2020_020169 [Hordeum vulgare]|nr:hypothetical protein ZWY2020_020169 [Hordeum vulgare]
MAASKPLALLLLVALSAMAMSAAGQGCGGHKVTVQNLCGHDLNLGIAAVADSKGAAVAKFHLGHDGGAYYEVSTDQANMPIRVSVTPHGSPLQGHCPTAGCNSGNHCFEHSVPGGNCHGVTEIKIVYYNP